MIVSYSSDAPAANEKPLEVSGEDVFVFPTSFAQRRLWVLDQLEPGNPAYNLPTAFHFRGLLSVAAVGQSLNEILRRHEILRTTFVSMDGQPVQVIALPDPHPLTVVDLRALSQSERQAAVQRLTTEEVQRSFDLTRGPLLRATLLHLDEEEHVLLLTVHHIVFDGWSMEVFLHELAALYDAFSAGRPSPLPQLL